ncbi:MAG TPA: hypothetical protein PLJ50_11905, partial [Candidatus Latescibacteria bacterium]|nr:hypothetical protein [Candidatus Latescibacterota bacterium]
GGLGHVFLRPGRCPGLSYLGLSGLPLVLDVTGTQPARPLNVLPSAHFPGVPFDRLRDPPFRGDTTTAGFSG